MLPTPPCSACPPNGIASNPNFGVDINTTGMTDVFIIHPSQINYFQVIKYLRLENKNVFITPIVKCPERAAINFKSCVQHCATWLPSQIQTKQPKLIITIGEETLLAFTGVSGEDHIGMVNKITVNNTQYWHLHLEEPKILSRLPERQFFNSCGINKIPYLLTTPTNTNILTNKKYEQLKTIEEIHNWFKQYADQPYMAIDIETGGTDEYGGVGLDEFNPNSYIILIQFCCKPGEAACVDLSTINSADVISCLFTHIKTKQLIGHNITFDLRFIRAKLGVNLWDQFVFDTMLADHTLREWDRHRSLKRLANIFLPEFENYEQPLLNWFKINKIPDTQRDYAQLPRQLLINYGCMDVDVTLRLFHILVNELKQQNLDVFQFDHIRRLARIYGDDMFSGWGMDFKYRNELYTELEQERIRAIKELQESDLWSKWITHKEQELLAQGKVFHDHETGLYFNNSNKEQQIPSKPRPTKNKTYTIDDITPDLNSREFKIKFLYDKAFLGLTTNRKTLKSNLESTDELTMIYLTNECKNKPEKQKILSNLVTVKKTETLISRYITPAFNHTTETNKFKRGWVKADNCIHPKYMLAGYEIDQGGTTTGRISCTDPNQTNIPSRGKFAQKIKKMYIPVPRDYNGDKIETTTKWYIVAFDYSQLELRVLADKSREPFMVNAYKNNADLHTELAVLRFNKPLTWFNERLKNEKHPEHQTAKDYRTCAKTSWFAFLYGAGPSKLVQTLAKQGVFISTEEMQNFIDSLRHDLIVVEQYRTAIFKAAPKHITRFGRRRIVPNYYSTDKELQQRALRQLFNFSIQSEGADICSRGMYLSCEWLREIKQTKKLQTYPMGNVYDSFILACPENELEIIIKQIKSIMENPQLPWKPIITFCVDVEYGHSWGEMKKWHEH